jgi:hypothetical protein
MEKIVLIEENLKQNQRIVSMNAFKMKRKTMKFCNQKDYSDSQ